MNVSELNLFALTFLVAALLQAGGQPSGVRAQGETCIEDGDCAPGMRCAHRDDQVCVDRPGEPPDCTPAQEGECEPAPIACAEDADCPLALRCETKRTVEECSATPASDGEPVPDAGGAEGCTRMEVDVEEPQCVYDLVACTQDSDCDDDFPCQPLGREEACTDSPSANCAPGEACAPSEPTCTTTRVNSYCFPARMDCVDDGDCRAGWRCAELPEDAQENPAEGWEGASRVCLPEGIALFLEGRVEAGASSSSSSEQAANRAGGAADAEEDGTESAPADDGPGANSSCSVRPGARGPGQRMLPAAWLLACVLALVRARRTRQA